MYGVPNRGWLRIGQGVGRSSSSSNEIIDEPRTSPPFFDMKNNEYIIGILDRIEDDLVYVREWLRAKEPCEHFNVSKFVFPDSGSVGYYCRDCRLKFSQEDYRCLERARGEKRQAAVSARDIRRN